jgi:zinc finger SWIM domain-containing protein 3
MCHLTPHLEQIILKCLLLQFLAPTIASKNIFLGMHLCSMRIFHHFIWLFESFVKAMSGKHLSTIFTDQDMKMVATIAYVFPNTTHLQCLWHIGQNAAKHLGPIVKTVEDEAKDKLGNKF